MLSKEGYSLLSGILKNKIMKNSVYIGEKDAVLIDNLNSLGSLRVVLPDGDTSLDGIVEKRTFVRSTDEAVKYLGNLRKSVDFVAVVGASDYLIAYTCIAHAMKKLRYGGSLLLSSCSTPGVTDAIRDYTKIISAISTTMLDENYVLLTREF